MGAFYMQSTCERCGGTGSYNKNPCLHCEGHGRTVQRRVVTVNVPAGINDGETVRMPIGKVSFNNFLPRTCNEIFAFCS